MTASPAIGEYVGDLADELLGSTSQEEKEEEDKNTDSDGKLNESAKLAPDGLIGVTAAATNPLPLSNHKARPKHHNSPVPTLTELAADYRRRGDGCVKVYGRVVRVTHPLASFGMESHMDDGSATS